MRMELKFRVKYHGQHALEMGLTPDQLLLVEQLVDDIKHGKSDEARLVDQMQHRVRVRVRACLGRRLPGGRGVPTLHAHTHAYNPFTHAHKYIPSNTQTHTKCTLTPSLTHTHTNAHAQMHTHKCICTHTHTHMHTLMHTDAPPHTHTHKHTRTRTHARTHARALRWSSWRCASRRSWPTPTSRPPCAPRSPSLTPSRTSIWARARVRARSPCCCLPATPRARLQVCGVALRF